METEVARLTKKYRTTHKRGIDVSTVVIAALVFCIGFAVGAKYTLDSLERTIDEEFEKLKKQTKPTAGKAFEHEVSYRPMDFTTTPYLTDKDRPSCTDSM